MSEVERFDAYYGYPSCRATGRHIHANGEFVLASDYDALAAELARVKAESLRVVKDGGECKTSRITLCGLFSYLGVVYRLYSFSPDEFGAWQVSDHGEHIFAPHTVVQPVRLERWEDVE